MSTIEVSGESRLLFISGQVGSDADGNVPADPEAQFEVALRNVRANVEGGDASLFVRRYVPGIRAGELGEWHPTISEHQQVTCRIAATVSSPDSLSS